MIRVSLAILLVLVTACQAGNQQGEDTAVCAKVQVACFSAPCPPFITKTYPDMQSLQKNKQASVLHQGACKKGGDSRTMMRNKK